jgi:hypothetical protein
MADASHVKCVQTPVLSIGSRTCALRIMFRDLSPSGGMVCISRRSAFDMCFQDPLPPCWPAPEHTSVALFTMINRCLS